MDEADRCDRVALIQRGRLLAVDTPAAIAQSFDRPLLAVRAADRYRALLALREYGHTHTVYPFGERCTTPTRGTDAPAGQIAAELARVPRRRAGSPTRASTPIAADRRRRFMARMGAPEGARAA